MTHKWNVNFLRVAHDWEVDVFTSIFNLLYSKKIKIKIKIVVLL